MRYLVSSNFSYSFSLTVTCKVAGHSLTEDPRYSLRASLPFTLSPFLVVGTVVIERVANGELIRVRVILPLFFLLQLI